jgi:4-hydroxy-4-methyl-2-oxoglutarate aldolase
MPADPPKLTVRRNFERPAQAEIDALRQIPTGYVTDAMGRRGALDRRILPLTRNQRVCGPALTVYAGPRDNLAPWASLAFARPGDVILVATSTTGGYDEAACIGDLMVGMARNCGVTGFVTDGLVRDIPGIDATGLAVFARGLTPNSPFKNGPGEVGLPIVLGGVAITPGDLVIGDQDGVVIVPRARIGAVVRELDSIKDKEGKMEALIRDGAKAPPWLAEALKKGVTYID